MVVNNKKSKNSKAGVKPVAAAKKPVAAKIVSKPAAKTVVISKKPVKAKTVSKPGAKKVAVSSKVVAKKTVAVKKVAAKKPVVKTAPVSKKPVVKAVAPTSKVAAKKPVNNKIVLTTAPAPKHSVGKKSKPLVKVSPKVEKKSQTTLKSSKNSLEEKKVKPIKTKVEKHVFVAEIHSDATHHDINKLYFRLAPRNERLKKIAAIESSFKSFSDKSLFAWLMGNSDKVYDAVDFSWYRDIFTQYEEADAQRKLKFIFSWKGFFYGFLYNWYRKDYFGGLAICGFLTLLSFLKLSGPFFCTYTFSLWALWSGFILCGLFAPRFLYLKYKRDVNFAKSVSNSQAEQLAIIKDRGGVHTFWMWLVLALLFVFVFSVYTCVQQPYDANLDLIQFGQTLSPAVLLY